MAWMLLALWVGAFKRDYSFREAWFATWSFQEAHEMMDDMHVGQAKRLGLPEDV